jgi:hypothetical protein
MTTQLRWAGAPVEPPASLDEHIVNALSKVPGLSAKQRNSVRAVVHDMVRDITFLRMAAGELRGPEGSQDEGRLL